MLEGTGMRTVIERLFQTTSTCGQALRQTDFDEGFDSCCKACFQIFSFKVAKL